MPIVMMTGGHAGLGLVSARNLAERYGCSLILAGRNQKRLEEAAQQLRAVTGANIEVLVMDLSSMASVRAAALRCKTLLDTGAFGNDELAGILCNAGVQFKGPFSISVDGYEETFAANCLGHFLLTNLLLNSLAPNGRVVWTTSGTHDPATMDGRTVGTAVEPDAKALADQGRSGRPISGGRRYATSKLCTIMYAYELHRRLRLAGSSIPSVAYDPGFMPDTGMGRMAPAIFRNPLAKFMLRVAGVTMGQMPFSGEALAILAADPEFARASGKYFQSKNGAMHEARSSVVSYDDRKAARLWSDSQELTHLQEAEGPSMVW